MTSIITNRNAIDDYREKNSNGLITVNQVAELLHVHPHSVRRWAYAGLLPCYRFGVRGDRRFAMSEVEEFLGGRPNMQEAV